MAGSSKAGSIFISANLSVKELNQGVKEAVASLQKIDTETKKINSSLATVGTQFAGAFKVAAVGLASSALVGLSRDLISAGNNLVKAERAWLNYGGSLEKVKLIQQQLGNTISTTDVLQKANRMAVAGFDTKFIEQNLANIISVAQKVAMQTGQEFEKVFNDNVLGIIRGSQMRLDETIGKLPEGFSKLNEEAKKLVIAEIFTAANARMGEFSDTAVDSGNKFNVAVSNLTAGLGKAITESELLIDTINALSNAINNAFNVVGGDGLSNFNRGMIVLRAEWDNLLKGMPLKNHQEVVAAAAAEYHLQKAAGEAASKGLGYIMEQVKYLKQANGELTVEQQSQNNIAQIMADKNNYTDQSIKKQKQLVSGIKDEEQEMRKLLNQLDSSSFGLDDGATIKINVELDEENFKLLLEHIQSGLDAKDFKIKTSAEIEDAKLANKTQDASSLYQIFTASDVNGSAGASWTADANGVSYNAYFKAIYNSINTAIQIWEHIEEMTAESGREMRAYYSDGEKAKYVLENTQKGANYGYQLMGGDSNPYAWIGGAVGGGISLVISGIKMTKGQEIHQYLRREMTGAFNDMLQERWEFTNKQISFNSGIWDDVQDEMKSLGKDVGDIFTTAFADIGTEGRNAFYGIGTVIAEMTGAAMEELTSMGEIIALNLGGNVDYLREMVAQLGLSTEDMMRTALELAEKGKISWAEWGQTVAGINEAMTEGRVGIGDLAGAMQNFFDTANRGNAALKAQKDIFIEAKEIGLTSLDQLEQYLVQLGWTAEQANAFITGAGLAGINSIEQGASATQEQLQSLASYVGNVGVFNEEWENALDFAQRVKNELNAIPDKIKTVVDIELNYHANGDVPAKNAIGNIYNQSGVVKFARGGVFSNPTLFNYAGGLGLLGEAGAEAIMPLKRNARGELGVSAEGVGGGVYQQVTNYNIDARGAEMGVENAILSVLERLS